MGREVIRLAKGTVSPVYYEVIWRGGDMLRHQFSPGLYMARIVPLKYGEPIKACPEAGKGLCC